MQPAKEVPQIPVDMLSSSRLESSTIKTGFADHFKKCTDLDVLFLAADNLKAIASKDDGGFKPLYFGNDGTITPESKGLMRGVGGKLSDTRNLENLVLFMERLNMAVKGLISTHDFDIRDIKGLLVEAKKALEVRKGDYQKTYENAPTERDVRVKNLDASIAQIDDMMLAYAHDSSKTDRSLIVSGLSSQTMNVHEERLKSAGKLEASKMMVQAYDTEIKALENQLKSKKQDLIGLPLDALQQKGKSDDVNVQITARMKITSEIDGLNKQISDLKDQKSVAEKTKGYYKTHQLSIADLKMFKGVDEINNRNSVLTNALQGKSKISERKLEELFNASYFTDINKSMKRAEVLLNELDKNSSMYNDVKAFYVAAGKMFSAIDMLLLKPAAEVGQEVKDHLTQSSTGSRPDSAKVACFMHSMEILSENKNKADLLKNGLIFSPTGDQFLDLNTKSGMTEKQNVDLQLYLSQIKGNPSLGDYLDKMSPKELIGLAQNLLRANTAYMNGRQLNVKNTNSVISEMFDLFDMVCGALKNKKIPQEKGIKDSLIELNTTIKSMLIRDDTWQRTTDKIASKNKVEDFHVACKHLDGISRYGLDLMSTALPIDCPYELLQEAKKDPGFRFFQAPGGELLVISTYQAEDGISKYYSPAMGGSLEHDKKSQTIGVKFEARKKALSDAYNEFIKAHPDLKNKTVVLSGFGAMAGPLQTFALDQVEKTTNTQKFICLSMGGWDFILGDHTERFQKLKENEKNLLIVDLKSPLDKSTKSSTTLGTGSLPSDDIRVPSAVQIPTFRAYEGNWGDAMGLTSWHERPTYTSNNLEIDLQIMNRMVSLKEFSKTLEISKYKTADFASIQANDQKIHITKEELSDIAFKRNAGGTLKMFADMKAKLQHAKPLKDGDEAELMGHVIGLLKADEKNPKLLNEVRDFFDFLHTHSSQSRKLAERLLGGDQGKQIKNMLWPTAIFLSDPVPPNGMSKIDFMTTAELINLRNLVQAHDPEDGRLGTIDAELTKRSDYKKPLESFSTNGIEVQVQMLGSLPLGVVADEDTWKTCAINEKHVDVAKDILGKQLDSSNTTAVNAYTGAYRILQKHLQDLLAANSKGTDNVKAMSDVFAILAGADAVINQVASRSPYDQSNLAKASKIVLDAVMKEPSLESVKAHLEAVQKIHVMENQPLGDLQALAAKKKIDWVQSGDDSVRRREVRMELKTLKAADGTQKPQLEVSFLLPRASRDIFDGRLANLQKCQKELGVKIEQQDIFYNAKDFSDGTYHALDPTNTKITPVNMGKGLFISSPDNKIQLCIGNDKEKWNQYQKVKIMVDPSVKSDELHMFLSLMGLQSCIFESTPTDVHNEKFARLANAADPGTLALQPNPLKVVASTKREDLQTRAAEMQLCDIGFGRMEYCDGQAVKDFWQAGGRGFGATLGHIGISFKPADVMATGGITQKKTIENSANDLALIMGGGFLSTVERFERGITGQGNAPEENIATGSGNQVFFRPMTANQFKDQQDWGNYAIEGRIFVLADARLAGRMPYGYERDRAGMRNPDHESEKKWRMAQKDMPEKGLTGSLMQERKPLTEICKSQQQKGNPLATAEVMFDEVVGKEFIYGAVVTSEAHKQIVMRVLIDKGINDINGTPLEEAIHVGNLSEDMVENIYKRET